MARLLIQFTDEALEGFRWVSCDEAQASGELDWQQADAGDLAAVTAQNPHPVIIVLPQQCIYLTQVELPEKASRQVLSAIEFQVEDQLAQDIETQHFALGNTAENPIAIAVVSRNIMERCMAIAQKHDLRLIQIVPELFLCPWQGSGAALTEGHDGCLLRYGAFRGLKCNSQALPAMLALVKHDIDLNHITYYARESEATPEIDGYELGREALSANRPGLFDAPLIDLQQRDYQLSSAWQGLGRAWKWVALLIAALLVIGAYNKAIALQDLEAELASIKQQQYALVKAHLPKDASPESNLKKMMIERMQELQATQREQGFLQLLLDFTRAHSKYSDVKITRVSYQSQKLSFDISSNKLNDIEALLDTVKKQGVKAKLESLNIKPEQSSGRLVLEGGSDV